MNKKGDRVLVRPMGQLNDIYGTIVDLDTEKGWIVIETSSGNIKKIYYGHFLNLDK